MGQLIGLAVGRARTLELTVELGNYRDCIRSRYAS